jgi:predicted secreted protein
MANLIVTEQHNNTQVRLHVGDRLTVRLEAIPGTGYSWIVKGEVGGVLNQTGEPAFERSGERVMGGVEQQVFSFQVKANGAAGLELEYRRPWEKSATASKSFSIRVIAEE